MPKTYVIADLHGMYGLLDHAFGVIAAREPTSATIITLGDYIDRGPNSSMIIACLMRGNPLSQLKLICLTGNHEQIMVETIRKPLHPEWWIANGGDQTLMSYGHSARGYYNPGVVPKEHLDWLAALPVYHQDKYRIYVHAGVEPNTPLEDQNIELLSWRIYPKGADGGLWKGGSCKHVVHGHEQFPDGPKLYLHRTNLDCKSWDTGRLVIGVFDDDTPGGPIDLIEITDDGRAPARSMHVQERQKPE